MTKISTIGAELEFFDDSKILEITFLPDVHIDLNIAKNIFRHASHLVNMRDHHNLVNCTALYKATLEARQVFAGIDSPLLKGCAIYCDDPIRNTISNFYSLMNKPLKPTERFTSRKDAVTWILDQQKKLIVS